MPKPIPRDAPVTSATLPSRPRSIGSEGSLRACLSRLLARAAPFVLGAVAAGIWLHRRQAERRRCASVAGELPPPVPPARPALRPAPRAASCALRRAGRSTSSRSSTTCWAPRARRPRPPKGTRAVRRAICLDIPLRQLNCRVPVVPTAGSGGPTSGLRPQGRIAAAPLRSATFRREPVSSPRRHRKGDTRRCKRPSMPCAVRCSRACSCVLALLCAPGMALADDGGRSRARAGRSRLRSARRRPRTCRPRARSWSSAATAATAVRKVQTALGIAADGVFGAQTEQRGEALPEAQGPRRRRRRRPADPRRARPRAVRARLACGASRAAAGCRASCA